MAKDPVCGRTVIEARSAARSRYRGKTYHFCGPVCQAAFDTDPEKYVKAEADQPGMQRIQAPSCCQPRS
ncbi:MAG: YHS domain-containing protein [Anaerolineae bacterium]|nr:YHS domain-containing protein [Anaerolineae bacterium]NIQ77057.1 YHS domain-containing protein [Anaerolineae bacterium]